MVFRHSELESTQSLSILVFIAIILLGCLYEFKTLTSKSQVNLLKRMSISLTKVNKTINEIERKSFHLCGLLVPIFYQISTLYLNWKSIHFVEFSWFCCIITFVGDSIRIVLPCINNYFPYTLLNGVIREKEKKKLSGTSYFALGCTLVISLFPKEIAIIGIVFLVLGDMAAALFGVSFGNDIVVVKMGRLGKKSLEGSVAMFTTCCCVGYFMLESVVLREYAIVFGALIATITELFEPFHLNDNITIPIFSCLAIHIALARINSC